MSMTKERAQEILRGYMTPNSPAINQFAQKGLVTLDLLDGVKSEIRTIIREWDAHPPTRPRQSELLEMLNELCDIFDYLDDAKAGV